MVVDVVLDVDEVDVVADGGRVVVVLGAVDGVVVGALPGDDGFAGFVVA